MTKLLRLLFVFILLLQVSQALAQNRDNDGINDILEYKLARMFAPEWRFHYRVPGDNSQQNNPERAYPARVEWFAREVADRNDGAPLSLRYYYGLNEFYEVTVTNIEQLGSMTIGGQRVDDTIYWHDKRSALKLYNFSKGIAGDIATFPTYYHCSDYGSGLIGIEYYLWFPDDDVGESGFQDFLGSHRGDWENITVVISGVIDRSASDIMGNPLFEHAVYYGHYCPGKVVGRTSTAFNYVIGGTHPMVFVAAGTHAMYPEPGEWHNLNKWWPIIVPYDDFFHGNGIIVQSWDQARELINLGEYDPLNESVSLKNWIRFCGLWGPDGDESNGSPKSPPFRGRWGGPGGPLYSADMREWDVLKNTPGWYLYTDFDNPPEIYPSVQPPGGLDADGFPRAVLFPDDHWHFDFWARFLTVGDYPILSEDVNNQASSIFLLGNASAQLWDDYSFSGGSFTLSHSCEDLQRHLGHSFGDRVSSIRIINQAFATVYVDWSTANYYQNGESESYGDTGPFSTIGRGVHFVESGGTVLISGGKYREILRLDKPTTIKTVNGSVIIGKFEE